MQEPTITFPSLFLKFRVNFKFMGISLLTEINKNGKGNRINQTKKKGFHYFFLLKRKLYQT